MDTSDYAGSVALLGERFRDVDILPRELEIIGGVIALVDKHRASSTFFVTAERVKGLAKAIENKDRPTADQILCCWGIR